MVAVAGTFQNGYVKLDKEFSSKEPVRVIVTFPDEMESSVEKRLVFSDFSFEKSQKILENVPGSLSDDLIEERRNSL